MKEISFQLNPGIWAEAQRKSEPTQFRFIQTVLTIKLTIGTKQKNSRKKIAKIQIKKWNEMSRNERNDEYPFDGLTIFFNYIQHLIESSFPFCRYGSVCPFFLLHFNWRRYWRSYNAAVLYPIFHDHCSVTYTK